MYYEFTSQTPISSFNRTTVGLKLCGGFRLELDIFEF